MVVNISYETMDGILRDWFETNFPENLKEIRYTSDDNKVVKFTLQIWEDPINGGFSTTKGSVKKDELRDFLLNSI